MHRQQLVLIVCRTNIDAATLQPLQMIMPTMKMAASFTLYTSAGNGRQIDGSDLYADLVKDLSVDEECSLTETLTTIIDKREVVSDKQRRIISPFRVCILGGQVINWDIVLRYQRSGIIIDTAGREQTLSQVAYTTGGTSRMVTPSNIIRVFETQFSKSSKIRKYFHLQQQQRIEYNVQPICCPDNKIKSVFYACSVCMTIYCDRCKQKEVSCRKCHYQFDRDFQGDNEEEIPLIGEKAGGEVN